MIMRIIFTDPSSSPVGTPSLTVLAHQRPSIHQLRRTKNAWSTLSPSASKRTLSWWPTVKGRVVRLGSRSCLGLLWATGSKASCSPGCTARQAAWPSVLWWQHGVSVHTRVTFDSLQHAQSLNQGFGKDFWYDATNESYKCQIYDINK